LSYFVFGHCNSKVSYFTKDLSTYSFCPPNFEGKILLSSYGYPSEIFYFGARFKNHGCRNEELREGMLLSLTVLHLRTAMRFNDYWFK
jgi:hypothetical protein